MRQEHLIETLQQDIVIPECVQKKADQVFAAIKEEKAHSEKRAAIGVRVQPVTKGQPAERRKGKKSARKRIVFLAAAAVLAVGGVSAGAAAYMKWSTGFSEGMQASEEVQKKLEDSHVTAPVNKVAVDNGITVTAVQSIVDNYYAQISFKVEGFDLPEGMQPAFESQYVTVDGYDPRAEVEDENYDPDKQFSYISDFYNGLVIGEDGTVVRADGSVPKDGEPLSKFVLEDGSMECQLTLSNPRTKGAFLSKPLHIEFKNLGTYDRAEYVPQIEGTWSFDWDLTGSGDMKVYDLDAPLEGTDISVTHAEVSPISLYVTYDYPRTPERLALMEENGFLEGPPELAGVKMKDGTMYHSLYLGPGSMGYRSEDSDEYFLAFPIDRILDVDEVEALLFIKNSRDGTYTEDDFYVVPLEG